MTAPRIDTRLRDTTLKLLKERPRSITFQMIADETDIPKTWLEKFAQERTENPSVNFVFTLYQYLAKTKIELIEV